MKNEFKIGERVDVRFAPTKRWESKRGFANGYISYMDENTVSVSHDEKTTRIDYHRFCGGGCYTNGSSWVITKSK